MMMDNVTLAVTAKWEKPAVVTIAGGFGGAPGHAGICGHAGHSGHGGISGHLPAASTAAGPIQRNPSSSNFARTTAYTAINGENRLNRKSYEPCFSRVASFDVVSATSFENCVI